MDTIPPRKYWHGKMNIISYSYKCLSAYRARVLSKGALPCSVVSMDPPIIAAFSWDWARGLEGILSALPSGRKTYVLLKLGYECETSERLAQEIKCYHRTDDVTKRIEITYLCNSPREVKNLQASGIPAILCNHNAFLDEQKYAIFPRNQKSYEAVYLARLIPCKRHHLARRVKRLLVIGDYKEKESQYALSEMGTIPHATWLRRVYGFTVDRHLASAHVGLCLSDREGAMYASTEYLLCGLPVVSTPNIGGRDAFFDPHCVKTADPDEEAVAEGVYELIRENLDPYHVREVTLKKIAVHRANFFNLIESIYQKERKDFRRDQADKSFFFHKLGLRTIVSPEVSRYRLLRPGTLVQV